MTLVFASLGFSPRQWKAGIDQCSSFRRQIRSLSNPPEGVSLLLVMHTEGRCEVQASYDRDDEKQAEWVRKASELSPEVWASLANRRKEVVV
jgi:hypothetical protein